MAKKVKKRHTTSKIVVADEGLRFVNRSGMLLASIHAGDDDRRTFRLYGVDGRALVTLGVVATTGYLRVGSGENKITMHVGDKSAMMQVFSGGNGPQIYFRHDG